MLGTLILNVLKLDHIITDGKVIKWFLLFLLLINCLFENLLKTTSLLFLITCLKTLCYRIQENSLTYSSNETFLFIKKEITKNYIDILFYQKLATEVSCKNLSLKNK